MTSGLGGRRLATHVGSPIAAIALLLVAEQGHANGVGYAFHAEAAAARMVGEDKVDQFGWGAAVLATPELTLGAFVGIEVPLGFVALTDGVADEPGLRATEAGSAIFALPGLRLRPFGRQGDGALLQAAGLWLAGGAGAAETRALVRPSFDARVGYDLRAAPWRFGPHFAFLQIVETESEVRPQDARLLLVGLHGSFEPEARAPAQRRYDPPDRDGDGIRNAVDACPDQAEDFDGFQDLDGCPDPDNDQDGIADPQDECPLIREDIDGFEDRDGCPDRDNDQDGVLDVEDGCPLVPEDIDGFDDQDGCPEADNDGDGIVDTADDCPNDPETFNGYADEDGCPDVENVRVEGKEIVLDDRVYFRVNSAKIEVRSWPLIENVAKLLRANPQYELVHVQGHADETGEEDYNLKLSVERGMSVRDMLIAFGVEPDRLTVEGYGERRPAERGETEAARRRNRRVEFLLLKRTRQRGEAAELGTDWLRKALVPHRRARDPGPGSTPAHPPPVGGKPHGE